MSDLRTPGYAEFRVWIQQLALLRAELIAQLDYAFATSFCSDCPRRDPEDGRYCCKETGAWDDEHESDTVYLEKINAAQKTLRALIPEDES